LSVVFALVIAFLVMLSNADLRPQSCGLVGFASLLALARGRLPFPAKISLAVPLLVLWQNSHPSVTVGAAALAGLAAGEVLDGRRGHGSARELMILAVLAFVAQVATPATWGIFDVSRTNLVIGRDVLRVPEWLPPWDPTVVEEVTPYWLVLTSSLWAILCSGRGVAARDRALFLTMTALSLYAARFIIFWAVASVPIWAELVERLVPVGLFAWARTRDRPAAGTIRSIAGLAAGLAIVLGLHPARFRAIVRPEVPLEGVAALRAALPARARIYNDYFWAGPLLFYGASQWRVLFDGRLYLFADPAEWREFDDARTGRTALAELERRYHPDAFFLHTGKDRALIECLARSSRWRACFSGRTCVAFVPGT
jgi:hypothetical protein